MMILNTKRFGNSGPHLIMMHGWGQSLKALQSMGELLSDKAQVHLIDLPGFGETPPPDKEWGVEEYACRILEYLDDNGIEQADILGHSFGGRIAMVLAACFPHRVRKAVLINVAGIDITPTIKQKARTEFIKILREAFKKVDGWLNTNFYQRYFIPNFASKDYLDAGDMRATFVKVLNCELSGYAARITAPTLMLWGEDDTETPVSIGYKLKALIAHSKLLVFKGRGHQLFSGAGAHLCAYHIKPFIIEDCADV